jgi:hypothetical protein
MYPLKDFVEFLKVVLSVLFCKSALLLVPLRREKQSKMFLERNSPTIRPGNALCMGFWSPQNIGKKLSSSDPVFGPNSFYFTSL